MYATVASRASAWTPRKGPGGCSPQLMKTQMGPLLPKKGTGVLASRFSPLLPLKGHQPTKDTPTRKPTRKPVSSSQFNKPHKTRPSQYGCNSLYGGLCVPLPQPYMPSLAFVCALGRRDRSPFKGARNSSLAQPTHTAVVALRRFSPCKPTLPPGKYGYIIPVCKWWLQYGKHITSLLFCCFIQNVRKS